MDRHRGGDGFVRRNPQKVHMLEGTDQGIMLRGTYQGEGLLGTAFQGEVNQNTFRFSTTVQGFFHRETVNGDSLGFLVTTIHNSRNATRTPCRAGSPLAGFHDSVLLHQFVSLLPPESSRDSIISICFNLQDIFWLC